MPTTTLLARPGLRVVDYRCEATRGDEPFSERHDAFSLAYVRKGSFGYKARGREHELVAGAPLAGSPGAEYVGTRDHAAGDECLSVHVDEALVESIASPKAWKAGGVPPLPELMVLGELAQAAADGRSDVGI